MILNSSIICYVDWSHVITMWPYQNCPQDAVIRIEKPHKILEERQGLYNMLNILLYKNRKLKPGKLLKPLKLH